MQDIVFSPGLVKNTPAPHSIGARLLPEKAWSTRLPDEQLKCYYVAVLFKIGTFGRDNIIVGSIEKVIGY